jgi:diguanylate cyclase (GGDEF)-like protein
VDVEPPGRRPHRLLALYVGGVVALGALSIGAVFAATSAAPAGHRTAVLVVVGLASLILSFPLIRTGTAGARTYDLVEMPLTAALLLLDPRRAVIAFMIGTAVTWLVNQRHPMKFAFGLGSRAVSASAAALVVVAADRMQLPGAPGVYVPVAIAAHYVINETLNCFVYQLAGVRRRGEPFVANVRSSLVVASGSAVVGGFVGVVGRTGDAAVLLSLAPVALLFLLSRAHANRARAVELLQGIVDAAADTHAGMSVHEVEDAVCERVLQVLTCPTASLRSAEEGPGPDELGAVVETTSGRRWLVAAARPVEAYRPEEADLLRALAGMAGRALENAQLHEQLARQALHDPLTGVANRRLVVQALSGALARARRGSDRVGVAFLDLTGFKALNDRMGHEAGDELLCRIAERLASSVRSGDVVGRFGGDEFVVLFLSPDHGDLTSAVARVTQAISTPFAVESEIVGVGCNVGLAVWPEHGDDAAELLRQADKAMYAAKRQGIAMTTADPLPAAPLAAAN